MKKVLFVFLALVMVATVAKAGLLTDYAVKVTDGSPSAPAVDPGMTDDKYGCGRLALAGRTGWGSSGGNFQVWANDSNNEQNVSSSTYDDANFAVSWGSWTLCTMDGNANGIGPGSIWGEDYSGPQAYDDYGAGNQTVKMFTSFADNVHLLSLATDSQGITFTTPVEVTVVCSFEWHKTGVFGRITGGHGTPGGYLPMTSGGYLGALADNMGGENSTVTALTSVPDDLWQKNDSIDMYHGGLAGSFGAPWGGWRGATQKALIRLCDGNIAGLTQNSSWTNREGVGLWISTVADTVPGNIAVEGDHTNHSYRNSATTAAGIMGPQLLGRNTPQVAGANTRVNPYGETQAIPLSAREQDTATQFLMVYTACWNDPVDCGVGFAKLMITGQKGDLNYDGKTDFNDLPLLSGTWNASLGDGNYNPDGDLNGDNKVDFNDLPTLSGYWNGQCQ
jgi:hypothetical protein